MGKRKRALGLMSGTSMDGIDVAVITTDGRELFDRGPASSVPYTVEQRTNLRRALEDAKSVEGRSHRPGCLADVEREITELHAAAVAMFLDQHGIDRASIDLIGFHGQTVLHRPDIRLSVQLGDGPRLAALTGIPVAYDMRAADVASGGQGAPLAPVYHRALAASLRPRPIAIVNIGGVANVTWIGRDGRLLAFDTGPGNALIDDWMLANTGAAFDENGEAALAGAPDLTLVGSVLGHPFFALAPPKSLDRNSFVVGSFKPKSIADGAATLAALTAASLAKAREHMPEEPELWVICGGGRKNRAIMMGLAERVHNAVAPAEAAGFAGDFVEAEAWAYLAVRSLMALPITFPGTTGAPRPMTGGVIVAPS